MTFYMMSIQEFIKWPFSGIKFSTNFPDFIPKVLTGINTILRFLYALSERALATLYVGMGPVFSVLGDFDTPETHIRHVQNFILIAEMESAS